MVIIIMMVVWYGSYNDDNDRLVRMVMMMVVVWYDGYSDEKDDDDDGSMIW